VTPAVLVSPSSSSITTAQALTVIVGVAGGSGNPTPTGSVILSSGSYSNQQSLAAGSTTFSLAAGVLSVGIDVLSATYIPDASDASTYTNATQSASVIVTQAIGTTVATLTATSSISTITNLQNTVVTVVVSGGGAQATPTGTVSLTSGSYNALQALSGGAASFSVAGNALSSGANSLTANYSGDPIYAAASAETTVTVTPVVMTVPILSSVSPGGSATGNVTLTAGSTYAGTMNLTCALNGSPANAQSLPTCNLNRASVTLAAGGSGTTALTVNTTAASSASVVLPAQLRLWGIRGGSSVLAVVFRLGIPARRRRWPSMMLLLLLVFAAAGGIGCGAGGGQTSPPPTQQTPATTAGTYTFEVTATDSANSKITTSASVTIAVQ
jgi:hypothetical protein